MISCCVQNDTSKMTERVGPGVYMAVTSLVHRAMRPVNDQSILDKRDVNT